MRKDKFRILLAILTILIATLACLDIDLVEPPAPATKDPLSNPCNGTQYLKVDASLVKDEVNEFKTRTCEFNLTITNTHSNLSIWPVVYHHHEDGYQNIKGDEWDMLIELNPSNSVNWFGNINTYTDPDVTGPVMNTVEAIAGVIDLPECAGLWFDYEYLDYIAINYDAGLCR